MAIHAPIEARATFEEAFIPPLSAQSY